jgi:hypothetical protein
MKRLMGIAIVAACVSGVACGGNADTAEGASADITAGEHLEVSRGKLERGEPTPLSIVEKVGPEDSNHRPLDLTKTNIAGAEARLLEVFRDNEFFVRGDVTQRDSGRVLPNGSRIFNEVIVVSRIATIKEEHARADGLLQRTNGAFRVVRTSGTGADTDDASSFDLDLGSLAPPDALVGKHVTVEGTLARELKSVLHDTFFISNDLMIATSIHE